MEQDNNTRKVELVVSGMHCGSCAQVIQDGLDDVTGVKTAAVSFESGTAQVFTEADVSTDVLVKAVAEAGYRAEVSDGEKLPAKKRFGWW